MTAALWMNWVCAPAESGGKMSNVVRRDQNVVVIYAEDARTHHRDGEEPKPPVLKAAPEQRHPGDWRRQNHEQYIQVLETGELNFDERVCFAVPQRGQQMKNTKGCQNDLHVETCFEPSAEHQFIVMGDG